MTKPEDKTIIVFCGPESTGKSTVSKAVSSMVGAYWVPEYARGYVEALHRPYTYDDVLQIAQKQIDEYKRLVQSKHKIIIFDTFLIITKVWLDVVYNKVPHWITDELKKINIDMFILCRPDIPWVPDGVRENKDKRQELYECYKKEIESYGFLYEEVSGEGDERVNNTIRHINHILTKSTNHDDQSYAIH